MFVRSENIYYEVWMFSSMYNMYVRNNYIQLKEYIIIPTVNLTVIVLTRITQFKARWQCVLNVRNFIIKMLFTAINCSIENLKKYFHLYTIATRPNGIMGVEENEIDDSGSVWQVNSYLTKTYLFPIKEYALNQPNEHISGCNHDAEPFSYWVKQATDRGLIGLAFSAPSTLLQEQVKK